MSKQSFTNSVQETFSHVVDRMGPYPLHAHRYNIVIEPQSKLWRFGIRLSKKEEIDFAAPDNRYRFPAYSDEYKDICVAVGEFGSGRSGSPNTIEVGSLDHTGELTSQISYRYTSCEKVGWRFSYESGFILASLKMSDGDGSRISINVGSGFRYFRIFAWLDNTEMHLSYAMSVEVMEGWDDPSKINEICVGAIRFRCGSIFDYRILDESDVLALPVSSQATMTSSIRRKSLDLNFPYVPPKPMGTFVLRRISTLRRPFFAGFAYSVDNNSSNLGTVKSICTQLLAQLRKRTEQPVPHIINLPLLGTGAGQLSPADVAAIYEDILNGNKDYRYIVSILSVDIFQEIVKHFKGRFYIPEPTTSIQPTGIAVLEKALFRKIDSTSYETDRSGNVIRLELQDTKLGDLDLAEYFPRLRSLTLVHCSWNRYDLLEKLPVLTHLDLRRNHLIDCSFVQKLRRLNILDLSDNVIVDIAPIVPLRRLRSLSLNTNAIEKVNGISQLRKNLRFLDLGRNMIEDIREIGELRGLTVLDLSGNRISNLKFLSEMNRLHTLLLAGNFIMEPVGLESITTLHYLDVLENPFANILILDKNSNHLGAVRNYLLQTMENDQTEVVLPTKVLLLGNHGSGKSSLLQFMQTGSLLTEPEATHIIRIENYETANHDLPRAIFFDFGGQDYYHGLYRAFLTAGSMYILLWNTDSNSNRQRPDKQNIQTRDFTLPYWLCQKQYMETHRFQSDSVPALIIQTHSEKDKKAGVKWTGEEYAVENEFFVSLKTWADPQAETPADRQIRLGLQYLKATIDIELGKRCVTSRRPFWYLLFLRFILQQSKKTNHKGKDIKRDILPHYERSDTNKLQLLQDDLDQLHRHGLIIYYRKEIPDSAWLAPVALVNYVHNEILKRDAVRTNGGRIPKTDLKQVDPQILRLLQLQKVIFEDGPGGDFVVPSFLPLAAEDSADFDLFTFDMGTPVFVLKFLRFLPFGLINQIIEFFGKVPQSRRLWRDQILFTFAGKAKVFINLDFNDLEIKVHAYFRKDIGLGEADSIRKYLFYALMGLYWDRELLDLPSFTAFATDKCDLSRQKPGDPYYAEFSACRDLFEEPRYWPSDLHVSIDDTWFVQYTSLHHTQNMPVVPVRMLDTKRCFTGEEKLVDVHPFNLFVNIPFPARKTHRHLLFKVRPRDDQSIPAISDAATKRGTH